MAASSRGNRALVALLQGTPKLCSRCAAASQISSGRTRPQLPSSATPSRRFYSASPIIEPPTAGISPEGIAPPSIDTASKYPPPTPKAHYRIKSGLILTRPPLLTREPTPFENSFYLYQKRLNERLAAPFLPSLYFKRDTAADLDWRIKLRERDGVAGKEIGRYHPRGRMAWNDELLVGSTLGEPQGIVDRLVRDAEMRVSEDGEEIPPEERVRVERPLPRRTAADEAGDVRRLDRALERTLYLVVQRKDGRWVFPTGDVRTTENLHETAARALADAAGVNMNTWIVGRVPVGHVITKPVYGADEAVQEKGEKVFFLKGRIMAGQADLRDNKQDLTDFKWLTREELQETLTPEYYQGVRNMMADR